MIFFNLRDLLFFNHIYIIILIGKDPSCIYFQLNDKVSKTEVYSQVLASIVNALPFELPGRQRSTRWGGLPQAFCSNKPHQTTWTTIKFRAELPWLSPRQVVERPQYKPMFFRFWPILFHSLGKILTRMVSLLFTVFV